MSVCPQVYVFSPIPWMLLFSIPDAIPSSPREKHSTLEAQCPATSSAASAELQLLAIQWDAGSLYLKSSLHFSMAFRCIASAIDMLIIRGILLEA